MNKQQIRHCYSCRCKFVEELSEAEAIANAKAFWGDDATNLVDACIPCSKRLRSLRTKGIL